MSRTDKTRPYRIRREDTLEPLEWSDILDEWHLPHWVFSPWGHSTKIERRVYGHKPDRARIRRQLRDARWDHELDVWGPQARHSVDWLVS